MQKINNMILGFKEQFRDPILLEQKLHTIRTDEKNRWKKGREIHFATGVRTKKFNQFMKGKCFSTQKISFYWYKNLLNQWSVTVFIDGRNVTTDNDLIDRLAKNDGFSSRKEFFEWPTWHKKNYTGKIIHWTDLKY